MSDLHTKLHMDGDKMHIENVQDATPYLERAKALHNEGIHGSADFRHAAEIPAIAVHIYMNKHGIDFSEFMTNPAHIKSMLNDPDLKHTRIWAGKV